MNLEISNSNAPPLLDTQLKSFYKRLQAYCKRKAEDSDIQFFESLDAPTQAMFLRSLCRTELEKNPTLSFVLLDDTGNSHHLLPEEDVNFQKKNGKLDLQKALPLFFQSVRRFYDAHPFNSDHSIQECMHIPKKFISHVQHHFTHQIALEFKRFELEQFRENSPEWFMNIYPDYQNLSPEGRDLLLELCKKIRRGLESRLDAIFIEEGISDVRETDDTIVVTLSEPLLEKAEKVVQQIST